MANWSHLDTTGPPSFTGLQERHRHIKADDAHALAYYAFDLLDLNGRSWIPVHAPFRVGWATLAGGAGAWDTSLRP